MRRGILSGENNEEKPSEQSDTIPAAYQLTTHTSPLTSLSILTSASKVPSPKQAGQPPGNYVAYRSDII
jgi:hypothetical protein